MEGKKKGRVQVSMWMDEELAQKIAMKAEEMNNTVSGTAGYYVKLGMLAEERQLGQEGKATA